MQHILILGGTQEANQLASVFAEQNIHAVYSYAGRTWKPKPQPVPTRVGGFGGVQGMIDYLCSHGISHVIDATHPFAAQISSNAAQACNACNIPLMSLERRPWCRSEGDDWVDVKDISAAVAQLNNTGERVFLAIGKQDIAPFAGLNQHFFLLRFVEITGDEVLPYNCKIIKDRGPFILKNDMELLKKYQITKIVSKNSGGSGARAKIDAAREAGISVVMIARPASLNVQKVYSPEEVMNWLQLSLD
ncbi:MAG: cobalt-precorrin-6A reductase [Methyloligellaceae bacterium]